MKIFLDCFLVCKSTAGLIHKERFDFIMYQIKASVGAFLHFHFVRIYAKISSQGLNDS